MCAKTRRALRSLTAVEFAEHESGHETRERGHVRSREFADSDGPLREGGSDSTSLSRASRGIEPSGPQTLEDAVVGPRRVLPDTERGRRAGREGDGGAALSPLLPFTHA